MKYYKVVSSHWPNTLEFKSDLELPVGQCFRITKHDGFKSYPTRFKVVSVSETPEYPGNIVTIVDADISVESF